MLSSNRVIEEVVVSTGFSALGRIPFVPYCVVCAGQPDGWYLRESMVSVQEKRCHTAATLHDRNSAIGNALNHPLVTVRNCFLSEFPEKEIYLVHGLLF